jgi:DUF1680 family protein
MFLATGHARYVDVLELALYNAVLCGVSLEGTEYSYVNPLRNVEPLPVPLRWSRNRVPFVTSYCCPPNVLRTIAQANGYVFSESKDAIWVNLYGGSTLTTTLSGKPLELMQQTNYPWDGRVNITVSSCPDFEFALRLRIPGWAESAALSINGSAQEVKLAPATYAEIRRRWSPGDIVELQLPMPARLIEAHPLVEETRSQVAIKRGPIVYCLESPDLPAGIRVQDVVIPAATELVPRHRHELLHGVTVVEAPVLVRKPGDWSDTLYRPLQRTHEQQIKVHFIPYYAWANRGASEMSVWLPMN